MVVLSQHAHPAVLASWLERCGLTATGKCPAHRPDHTWPVGLYATQWSRLCVLSCEARRGGCPDPKSPARPLDPTLVSSAKHSARSGSLTAGQYGSKVLLSIGRLVEGPHQTSPCRGSLRPLFDELVRCLHGQRKYGFAEPQRSGSIESCSPKKKTGRSEGSAVGRGLGCGLALPLAEKVLHAGVLLRQSAALATPLHFVVKQACLAAINALANPVAGRTVLIIPVVLA